MSNDLTTHTGSKWWRWRACGVWAEKKGGEWVSAFYVERHFKALGFKSTRIKGDMKQYDITAHTQKLYTTFACQLLGLCARGDSHKWGGGGGGEIGAGSCETSTTGYVSERKDGRRDDGKHCIGMCRSTKEGLWT